MTKRRLESDIDELSDKVLRDLPPDERFKLWLEANATENSQWIDRLNETCPTSTFRGLDLAYTRRKRACLVLALRAVYTLHTSTLSIHLLERQIDTAALREALVGDDPAVPEEITDTTQPTAHLVVSAYKHYIQYQAYRTFAEEELGVTLELWLGHYSHHSEEIIEGAERLVTDYRYIIDNFETLNQQVREQGHEYPTVTDHLTKFYDALLENWATMTDSSPSRRSR